MICDSNIVIYAAESEASVGAPFVRDANACIASITRVEVLGYPSFHLVDPHRRRRLEEIVDELIELPPDRSVLDEAIKLRRLRRMSLGDAIIAGTALALDVPLVTRNTDDFKHIPDLVLINPFEALE